MEVCCSIHQPIRIRTALEDDLKLHSSVSSFQQNDRRVDGLIMPSGISHYGFVSILLQLRYDRCYEGGLISMKGGLD